MVPSWLPQLQASQPDMKVQTERRGSVCVCLYLQREETFFMSPIKCPVMSHLANVTEHEPKPKPIMNRGWDHSNDLNQLGPIPRVVRERVGT